MKKQKYIFNQALYSCKPLKNGILFVSRLNFKYVRVNETGGNILFFLDGKNSAEDVVKKMSESYNIPAEAIREPVLKFISKVVDDNIVAPADNIYPDNDLQNSNKIKRLYLSITNECNLNCKFCNKINKTAENKSELSLCDIEEILDKLGEQLSEGASLYLTGGEPVLHSQFAEIVKKLKSKYKSRVFIISNGTSFSKSLTYELKSHIDAVMLTLFSSDKQKNDCISEGNHFEAFMHSFNMLKEAEIPLYLATTPTKHNLSELIDLHKFAKEKGFNGMFVWNPIKTDSWGNTLSEHFNYDDDEYQSIKIQLSKNNVFFNTWRNNRLKSAETNFSLIFDDAKCFNNRFHIEKKIHCGIGANEVLIDCAGKFYPCHMLNIPELVMGEADDYLSQRNLYTYKKVTNEKCDNCFYWIFCLGGCRAKAYYEVGKFNSLNRFCEAQQEMFSNSLES